MADALASCRSQYEKDLAAQTYCCVLAKITPEHQKINRAVFNKLCEFQEALAAQGSLPYSQYEDGQKGKKDKSGNTANTVVVRSSVTNEEVKINYPEGLRVPNPRLLKQIMPIPDIHKVSDCDTIYRFLIARKFDANLCLSDILSYISFREKYDLDNILWDAEVEAMFNGLDGEELLQQTMAAIAKRAKDKKADINNPDDLAKKVNLEKIKVERPLLQPGWAAWNSGVDKTGHVLFYQRPNPRALAYLEKRWRYSENEYDCRNPDFHSVTPPYSNLLVRLYLRIMEKGRRLSRLLNYKDQYILREGMKLAPTGGDGAAFHDNGGGLSCVLDVASVKVSHMTGSKCRDAVKVFRVLSMMGQCFYPENMKRMIIINGGFVFNMLYKLVRPWLDPQTQKKLILLSATNKTSVDELSVASGNDPSSPSTKSNGSNGAGDDNSEHEDDDAATALDMGLLDKANFGLRNALSEYIDDHFIPPSYGGKLHVREAPVFYGNKPPRQIAESPYFPLAKEKLRAVVLPELLPDDFLRQHAAMGSAICDDEFNAFCELTKSSLFK